MTGARRSAECGGGGVGWGGVRWGGHIVPKNNNAVSEKVPELCNAAQ